MTQFGGGNQSLWGRSNTTTQSRGLGTGTASTWNRGTTGGGLGLSSTASKQVSNWKDAKGFAGKEIKAVGWGSGQAQSQQSQLGRSTLGTGNALGGRSGIGGIGGRSAFGGLGVGRTAYGQPQVQPVPISTIGFPFSHAEIEDKTTNNNKRVFKVYHISILDMFKQYTIEELRYWDYVKQGLIQPYAIPTNLTQTQQLTTFQNQGTTSQLGQQQHQLKSVQWYEVPLKEFAQIQPPPKNPQPQPFGALKASQLGEISTEDSTTSFSTAVDSYELRGFSKRQTLVDKINQPGLYNEIKTPGYTKLEGNQKSNVHQRRSSMSGVPSDTGSPSNKSSPLTSSHLSSPTSKSSMMSPRSFSRSYGLDSVITCIPNIYEDNNFEKFEVIPVTNLIVQHRDNGSVSFPKTIDAKMLDPENNIILGDDKDPSHFQINVELDCPVFVEMKKVCNERIMRDYCKEHGYMFISFTSTNIDQTGCAKFYIPSLGGKVLDIELPKLV